MSSSDSEEEDRAEYERRRAKRRKIKPWEKRIENWLEPGGTNTADELMAISEFGATVHMDDLDVAPYDTLETTGHLMPVEEMRKLCEWWHTDPDKRRKMNRMLQIYSKGYGFLAEPGDGWNGKEGPEHDLVKCWMAMSPEQRAYLKTTNVTPSNAWDGICNVDDHHCSCLCPVSGEITWEFIDEFVALCDKHSKK
jgi:hypothetical protein